MPIYEYRCSSCGHELESLQKFSDAPLTTCPSCNTDALVKQLSAGGFQLKGSGWYASDFKGSGAKPAPKSEGGDAKPDAKSETKSESKGESKGQSKGETKAGTGTGSKSDTASSVAAPAATTGATPASS